MPANITPRKDNYPDEKSNFDTENQVSRNLIEEGDDVLIWYEDYDGAALVFVTVGNTTINMPEDVFYRLTKAVQRTAKELLGLE